MQKTPALRAKSPNPIDLLATPSTMLPFPHPSAARRHGTRKKADTAAELLPYMRLLKCEMP